VSTSGFFLPDPEKKPDPTPEAAPKMTLATALALGQTGLGVAQQLSIGKRPKDSIDQTLINQRDEAISDARKGIDPAIEQSAKDDMELKRRTLLGEINSYAGSSPGLAVSAAKGANREVNRSIVDLAAKKEEIRAIKNNRADTLTKIVSDGKRSLFKDDMDAFMQNQKSAGDLINAGLTNAMGSLEAMYLDEERKKRKQ